MAREIPHMNIKAIHPNARRVDEESHLVLKDDRVCIEKCGEQPCLYICPANVYRLEKDRINHRLRGLPRVRLVPSRVPPLQH